MADELEGGTLAKITGPIGDAVKKIGIAKIGLAIIILAAVYFFLSAPQPGSLQVRVTALDEGSTVQDAIVTLVKGDGQPLGAEFSGITDSSGVVRFTNVPAGELAVQVSAPDFASASEQITLESRESKTADVKMAKEVSLTLTPSSLRVTASETCTKQVSISIRNDGEIEQEISLVGSGPLASAVSSPSFTLQAGAEQNVTASIDVSKTNLKKGSTTTSALRVRGTNEKATLELRVTDTPRVEVEPAHIICGADRQCQQIVTVSNNGQTPVENLEVMVSESVASVLEGGDVERFYSATTISPGGEAKFAVKIDASQSAIGVITVSVDCFEKQIDVKAG